jgi:hypothetical protein
MTKQDCHYLLQVCESLAMHHKRMHSPPVQRLLPAPWLLLLLPAQLLRWLLHSALCI